MTRSRNQAGFTIIGAIVMMLLVSAFGAGLMTYFMSSSAMALDSDMTVTAAALAQEQIDRMVANKVALGFNSIVPANYPSPLNLPAPFVGFTRTTTITDVNPLDPSQVQVGSGVKRIDVALRWGQNAAQQIMLTTMVGRY